VYRKLQLSSFLISLSMVMTGCGAQEDMEAASAAVTQFHGQLDHQDYLSIYKNADERPRSASKQDDFLALMNAIHTKLGTVQHSSRQGFFVNYNTSGTSIRLTYATKFSGGDAEKQFVWSKSGDTFRLLGYHINSNALITK